MSRRGSKRKAAIGAALVCVAVAVAMPAATPALAAGAKPDLVITKVKIEGLGPDPYLAIGPSGEAQRFVVRVTTANRGNAASGPSRTHVQISDESELAAPGPTIRVGRLRPGRSATSSVIVSRYDPPLGFTEVTATADSTHRVRESREANNARSGPRLPVVARQWDVVFFETKGVAGLQTHQTEAVDLYFRLKQFDEIKGQFEYKAIGSVKDTASETGTCNWHGEKTVELNPWPGGELFIAWKLNRYNAGVSGSDAPGYPVQVSCLGGLNTETEIRFQDLQTFAGLRRLPSMKPTATDLGGGEADPSTHTTFAWDFKAEIPR